VLVKQVSIDIWEEQYCLHLDFERR